VSKVSRVDIVDAIGWRQRRAFERDGRMNAGTTVDELASDLDVSKATVQRHLNDARRFWTLGERSRRSMGLDGRKLTGRPELEYWLVDDGHLWGGAGKPRVPAIAGRSDADDSGRTGAAG